MSVRPEIAYRYLMSVLFGPSGRPPEWRRHAACRGMDPALFADENRIAAAKTVCRSCPVQQPCRADQLEWESRLDARRRYAVGVVGGLAAHERRHRPNVERKVS
ncbi:hypothetical protein GCM10012275_49110 [Longimycelium tulufanense]|uniref:4Fe-4S Wbl-type domain-containing protein n=1 Tax=Longimycelium tulufanense TaxID=907463 RepID=A0A8J3CIQ3_9PSEU|nr:WhiB family transcriptional regulator [Longimycelium tulufanense]GGM72656.1 hypothetical protein GCM10012275_49110 [Longimycelium tulufanense]